MPTKSVYEKRRKIKKEFTTRAAFVATTKTIAETIRLRFVSVACAVRALRLFRLVLFSVRRVGDNVRRCSTHGSNTGSRTSIAKL